MVHLVIAWLMVFRKRVLSVHRMISQVVVPTQCKVNFGSWEVHRLEAVPVLSVLDGQVDPRTPLMVKPLFDLPKNTVDVETVTFDKVGNHSRFSRAGVTKWQCYLVQWHRSAPGRG